MGTSAPERAVTTLSRSTSAGPSGAARFRGAREQAVTTLSRRRWTLGSGTLPRRAVWNAFLHALELHTGLVTVLFHSVPHRAFQRELLLRHRALGRLGVVGEAVPVHVTIFFKGKEILFCAELP